LERLRLPEAALRMLPEQEPSHRIAFVSDKVLEPRWWQKLWAPGPRWGFASAMLLAGAIILHGWMTGVTPASPQQQHPALVAQVPVAQAPMTNASSSSSATLVSEAELEQRIAAAVARAAEEVEARQARKTAELLAATERRMQEQNQANLLAVQESFEVLSKRFNVMYLASSDLGGTR
jgi:hypothetical protein